MILEGFYVKDLDQDTLVKTPKLAVDITDFSIFTLDGITLRNIDLENGKIYLKTYKDSTSNLDFITAY
ncbi:MAG: hypothetical protein KKE39_01760, partial [Bacteroidetes bacterium]|nr:hypothetical protein [Bacteroidota bacterium]